MLERLAAETFDVLVVGGGITGAGVALDAATRGLRTALVEGDDFASGTSSKSSKLVHGGLRYLQQGDVRLVYEALHERQRLRRNAPHLVKLLPFMIPILTKDGVIPRRVARALGLGDVDVRPHRRVPHRQAPQAAQGRRRLRPPADDARERLARRLPLLRRHHRRRPARADDRPHRRRATARPSPTAAGSSPSRRTPPAGSTGPPSRPTAGASTSGARVVVNAAGVWADEVRALEDGVDPDSIRPAKGIHLTVPWEKVRNDIAVVIPVREDKRSLFVVPWGRTTDGTFEHTYIGTTDTDYDGPLDDPPCTADDIAYVLGALNAAVTTDVTADDVTGVWAGLRPLVKSATSGRTADLSRRHRVTTGPAGVIGITGGKLTTYREMAEDTVDEVLDALGARPAAARSG